MREALKKHAGKRLRFRATVARFGKRKTKNKSGSKGLVMLSDVRFSSKEPILTDHIWLNMCSAWSRTRTGNIVEFNARVVEYKKGYRGKKNIVGAPPPSVDYRLERPSKVCVVDPNNNA